MIISAQVPDRDVERLDALARKRGQSRAGFVKEAIARLMAEATPALAPCTPLQGVRVRSRKAATDGV